MPSSQHHYYLGILPPPQLTIAQRAEKEATNQRERQQCSSRFRMPTAEPSSQTSPLSSYSYFGHLKGRLFLPTSHFSVLFCPQPT